jgi:type IV secretory pathway VirB2 component (pilin)
MKKQVRIISIVLVVLMVLTTISNIVFASTIPDQISNIGSGNGTQSTEVSNLGKTIVSITQTIGIVVAVVVLLVLGIKYMIGSAEQKAEYKKTMIPYIVGAVLIFAATTIVTVIYNISTQISGTVA